MLRSSSCKRVYKQQKTVEGPDQSPAWHLKPEQEKTILIFIRDHLLTITQAGRHEST